VIIGWKNEENTRSTNKSRVAKEKKKERNINYISHNELYDLNKKHT
jgi:hypothetical protein